MRGPMRRALPRPFGRTGRAGRRIYGHGRFERAYGVSQRTGGLEGMGAGAAAASAGRMGQGGAAHWKVGSIFAVSMTAPWPPPKRMTDSQCSQCSGCEPGVTNAVSTQKTGCVGFGLAGGHLHGEGAVN